jgi:hypothetical protein
MKRRDYDRSVRGRLVRLHWRKTNPGRLRANTRRHRERLRLLAELGEALRRQHPWITGAGGAGTGSADPPPATAPASRGGSGSSLLSTGAVASSLPDVGDVSAEELRRRVNAALRCPGFMCGHCIEVLCGDLEPDVSVHDYLAASDLDGRKADGSDHGR